MRGNMYIISKYFDLNKISEVYFKKKNEIFINLQNFNIKLHC